MLSLARLRQRGPRDAAPPAPAFSNGSSRLHASFAELAEDLGELADLAAGFSERLRRRDNVMVRHRRHLNGDSLDVIEQHVRALIAAYDAIARDARQLRADTWIRHATPELLAGLAHERMLCADRLRTIAGIAGATMVASEWQSPSFAHSMYANAGTRTGAVRVHVDDYERDRHADAAAFEDAFLREYVEDSVGRAVRVLMTSCGMSAFATILSFLQMEGRLAGRVLLGASVYHECRDLVRSVVAPEMLIEVPEHPPGGLATAIVRHRPTAVFLDSIGNAPAVLVPELDSVVRAMRELDVEPYLVLDNTALSCTFQPFRLPLGERTHLLLFESLTKYVQFGLDRVTAGVIVADERDADPLDRYREHLGTNIADASVHALPWPDRAALERRLRRIGRNAVLLAGAITRAAEVTGRSVILGADHPGLAGHPSYDVARVLPFRGGWLSVAFSPEHDRPDVHDRLVGLALEEARRRGASLVAGATFGLDVTRIYPTGTSAASARPFVRISPGIEYRCQIERLAEAFTAAVIRLATDGSDTPTRR